VTNYKGIKLHHSILNSYPIFLLRGFLSTDAWTIYVIILCFSADGAELSSEDDDLDHYGDGDKPRSYEAYVKHVHDELAESGSDS